MAAAMAMTPLRERSWQTKPMRRIFSSRSSLLKPKPLERLVRTTSPSSTSTLAFRRRSRSTSSFEMVLLPAPDMPVNQRVNPLCMPGYRSIGGEMDAAFLLGVFFPPPAAGAFGLTFAHGPRAGRTADAGVAARIKRMHRHVMLADILVHLFGAPIGQGADLDAAIGLL